MMYHGSDSGQTRGRLLLAASLLCLAAAVAVVALGRSDGAEAQTPSTQQYVLKVGDSVRLDGADLGCQVTRRDGRATIECRRAGKLGKTYGTFFDRRGVTVARFKDRSTAQTILTARHGGSWRACSLSGGKANATVETASKSCR